MRVLVANAGSSSIKLSVVEPDGEAVAVATLPHADTGGDPAALDAFLRTAPDFGAVGHRVVHGGAGFRDAVRVTPAVEEALLALAPLAPLHQPRAVAAMRDIHALRPDLAQYACFDTAFHATLPPAAFTYALPEEWRARWGIRRYGFHGLSHAYATARAAELVGRAADASLRVVCCHLGSGASLCASRGGRSVDTTMGWTPLEGLVMSTRSGTVDPGAVLALVRELGADAVEAGLDRHAGLAGLSGIAGGDLRAVLAARAAGNQAAALAFDVYVHRLRRELGGMIAVLGGVDVLVFTGGVGEHLPEVRAAACATLGSFGIALDEGRNADPGVRELDGAGSAVRILVIPAREDAEIARLVRAAAPGNPLAD